MRFIKVIFGLTLLLVQEWCVLANSAPTRTQSSVIQTSDVAPYRDSNSEISASSVLGSMYRKSRQLRCVRCYEDRSGYDDRNRGSYSSRSPESDRNWYYPSYDNDRYPSSNYRDRDDRYSPRTYDRYEKRGYGDRYGGDRHGSDRYGSDRYGSDRYGSERYGNDRYGSDRYGSDRYGSDRYGSDRYGSDRYGDRYGDRDRYDDRRGDSNKGRYEDAYKDRYYDRSRDRGGDRDYNDRYYSRYDYRNYRPWDETYRGQSGFDNSGRGYYFAGDDRQEGNSRRYLPEPGRRCGILVTNCPYDRNEGDTHQAPPKPIENDNRQTNYGNNSNSNRNTGWNYMNEQDNQNHSNHGGGSGGGSGGNANSGSTTDRDRVHDRDRDRDQNRNQQSSSYGGRSPRPLGGSYLFDRESNDVNTDNQGNGNNAQTGKEAPNDAAINQQQQPRDGGSGNSADVPQARMMTGANEISKQS